MNQCPKCKSMLNNDEKACGKCFTCGATFESSLPQNTVTSSYNFPKKNSVGRALTIIGIFVIILGTISSFSMSFYEVHGSPEFSFTNFIIPEAFSLVSGIMFLGFGEIIKLLQDICNKIK